MHGYLSKDTSTTKVKIQEPIKNFSGHNYKRGKANLKSSFRLLFTYLVKSA